MQYTQAEQTYNSARDKSLGKPLENNTRLVKTDSGYGVKLHDTVVVEYLPDGAEVLNSGGWRTMTTKARINDYSSANLVQRNSQWFIGSDLYFDGIIIKNGQVVNPLPPVKAEKDIKRAAKLRKRINTYAELCAAAVDKGIEPPSAGDCWFCAFRDDSGKTWGDQSANTEHLLSHMSEKYAVPSLIYSAIAEAGYRYPSIIVDSKMHDSIKRAVAKYLVKRLVK